MLVILELIVKIQRSSNSTRSVTGQLMCIKPDCINLAKLKLYLPRDLELTPCLSMTATPSRAQIKFLKSTKNFPGG